MSDQGPKQAISAIEISAAEMRLAFDASDGDKYREHWTKLKSQVAVLDKLHVEAMSRIRQRTQWQVPHP